MTTQTPITNIAAALAKAQKKIGIADKNAVNTDKKSRFADMESVVESCREALADQEISILQPLSGSIVQPIIKTILLHSSGESMESEFMLAPETKDLDVIKSQITQMRRYSLMGMLCIATQDDDGAKKPAKPAEKKEPVQEKGPVIERHVAEALTPSPETTTGGEELTQSSETVTTSKQNDEWKEVVVHYGSDTSPAKGHKIGELDPEVLKFVQEKVLPALGRSKKDRALADAIEASKKAESTPAPAVSTLPEQENAPQTPPESKKEASSEPQKPAGTPEPMEWRSVKCHTFKPPHTGIALGELADSKPNQIFPEWDSQKIIRWLKKEGIPKLKDTTKDKILVNAILAANEELDLRVEVELLFHSVSYDVEKADAHLLSMGIFEKGETLATAPVKTIGYIKRAWSDIEKSIEGAK